MTVLEVDLGADGGLAEAWDDLAARRDLFASSGWLRYLAGAPGPAVSYQVVQTAHGLQAGWPTTLMEAPTNDRYDLVRILDGMVAAPEPAGPWLAVGSARGCALGMVGGEPDALDALSLASLAQAERRGAVGIVAFYASAADAVAIRRALRRCGLDAQIVLTDAGAVLPLRGLSLEEHLAACSSKRRRGINHERRRFAESGLQLELGGLSDRLEETTHLQHQLLVRHGSSWSIDRTQRSLSRLAAAMGDGALLTAVDEDGVAVAVCLHYRWGDRLYARVAGFDYPRLRRSFEYFALTCYEPLRLWAGEGISAIHLGLESLEAKVLRGAVLEPLWSVVAPLRSTLDPAGVDALNETRRLAWKGRMARHPAALDGRGWSVAV